jgi:hypothetical protein
MSYLLIQLITFFRFDMPSENQEIEMEGSCLEDEAFNNNFTQNYKTKLKYRGSKQGEV